MKGVFTAEPNIAQFGGTESTDIGVKEINSTAVGMSLQLEGNGTVYSDFTWAVNPLSNTEA